MTFKVFYDFNNQKLQVEGNAKNRRVFNCNQTITLVFDVSTVVDSLSSLTGKLLFWFWIYDPHLKTALLLVRSSFCRGRCCVNSICAVKLFGGVNCARKKETEIVALLQCWMQRIFHRWTQTVSRNHKYIQLFRERLSNKTVLLLLLRLTLGKWYSVDRYFVSRAIIRTVSNVL